MDYIETDDPAINITRTGIAAADTGYIITFEACVRLIPILLLILKFADREM